MEVSTLSVEDQGKNIKARLDSVETDGSLDPLIVHLWGSKPADDEEPLTINEKDIKEYLPSAEWVTANKDVIVEKILGIREGKHDFSRGDPHPWDDRSKLNQVLEKIEATELTEYLLSSEIMRRTDAVEPNPSPYETHELMSAMVEASQPPLDGADDEAKGKVLLFLMGIQYLVNLHAGSSIRTSTEPSDPGAAHRSG